METYNFKLEKYGGRKTRHQCPKCGGANEFTRYIRTDTGEMVAPIVGKCNRALKCGYHYTPYQYFAETGHFHPFKRKTKSPAVIDAPEPATAGKTAMPGKNTIPFEMFHPTLRKYRENNLVLYLQRIYGADIVKGLIERFYIGTSKHWEGSTIFWQIDSGGSIKAGKIMLYCPETGKRVKAPFDHITWVHSVLAKKHNFTDFKLEQCLFGEHQLIDADPKAPVALVESEKTAIIASLYFPAYILMACGSLTNLTAAKCKVLAGRNIVLFPDLKCFDKWQQKAQALACQINSRIRVSDLLERKAGKAERESGLDLADYLLRYPDKINLLSPPPRENQIDAAQATFQQLQEADPLLKQLVETFDLELIQTTPPIL